MKDKRPVNLDLGTMRLPITAWASISHRISGVVMFFGTAILIWMLDRSLKGPESFASLTEVLSSPLARLVVWAVLAALIYHTLAGIKHLVADFGVGETMEGGILGARLVIGASAVLALIAGAWLW